MIDTNALRGEMVANGISGKQMAQILGMSPKTFYTKIKIGVFGSDEIQKMIDSMTLSRDPMEIFFIKEVIHKVT